MNTYKTSEVAKLIGIHPNTVRLYENAGLISKPERQSNGYRIFTDLNIEQFRLARLAFQMEVLQNGLRKKAVRIVKTAASCDFPRALVLAEEYLAQIRKECFIKRIPGTEKKEKSQCRRGSRNRNRDFIRRITGTYPSHETQGSLPVSRHFYGCSEKLGNERPFDCKTQAEWIPHIYESGYTEAQNHSLPEVCKLFFGIHSASAWAPVKKSRD